MKKIVFDSYAVLTYLKEESGWQIVRNFLWDAATKKNTIFINYVNLGEIYYAVYREKGAITADEVVSIIKLWPIRFVEVKERIALIAGRMKAENKISYADAYVVASALDKKAEIVTGDREFKEVEDIVAINWLPRNK